MTTPEVSPWRHGLPDWASDDWINATWSEACLTYYENMRVVGSPGHEFVRRILAAESAAPLPVQGQEAAMLNEYEQREMMGNPHALLFLMDYHDMQQDQADSMGAECYGDILRYEELRQLGAKVIASDPECWDDEIRRRFAEPSGHRAKELERALRASSAPTTKGTT